MDEWQRKFLDASPMYDPLCGVGGDLAERGCWPDIGDYNALLAPPIYTTGGAALRFVPQAGRPVRMEDKYEARIYLQGEVQTRTENWHDLFNTLVWVAFPQTKTALNACHFASISQSSGKGNRNKKQDALTLFDESGVIVLYSDDELAQLLRNHRWHELFWTRRQSVIERMRFVIFGHSLYEKALRAYIGLTGKGLLVKVDEDFFNMSVAARTAVIDDLTAGCFPQTGAVSSQDLSPVPLLGVPGWWKENEDEVFYANARYFRAATRVEGDWPVSQFKRTVQAKPHTS